MASTPTPFENEYCSAARVASIARNPTSRSSNVQMPMWPIRKIRPFRCSWPPATIVRCLSEDLPKLRILDFFGVSDRGHRVRSEPAILEQFESEGLHRGPRRLGESFRARDSIRQRFLL